MKKQRQTHVNSISKNASWIPAAQGSVLAKQGLCKYIALQTTSQALLGRDTQPDQKKKKLKNPLFCSKILLRYKNFSLPLHNPSEIQKISSSPAQWPNGIKKLAGPKKAGSTHLFFVITSVPHCLTN